MKWDSLLAATAARALDGLLLRTRLRAFFLDRDALRLHLYFRERTLLFDLHPSRRQLRTLEAHEPIAGARSLAAEVLGVSAPPDDRRILIRVRKVRGGRERWTFALEWVPNRENAVVAEGDDPPVIRHLLREREGDPPLKPGSPYTPEGPPPRAGLDTPLSLTDFVQRVGADPEGRRGRVLSGIAWSSPINLPALLGAAPDGGEADDSGGGGADVDLERGYRFWRRIRAVAQGEEAVEPVVLTGARKVGAYPLALPHLEGRPADDLLDALDRAAAESEALEGPAALIPGEWLETLEDRAERAARKVGALERELEDSRDPGEARALGDLILARFGKIPTGAERVELEDFEGNRVEVSLDPKLEPHEQADRYYDRAARAERARERLPGRIRKARAEAARWSELLEGAREGEVPPDEILEAIPELAESEKSRKSEGPTLPYRRYRSSGGLEIRVGRSAKANDDLTFHHSNPDDVWMHARHVAGSHVILRWPKEGNPPARDMAEAASLAALNSKARGSATVPVDWTRRKYVRKPRKAPPGAVVPDRTQTIFAEPSEELEERLRDE